MKNLAFVLLFLPVFVFGQNNFEERLDKLIENSNPYKCIADAIRLNTDKNYPLYPLKETLRMQFDTLMSDMGFKVDMSPIFSGREYTGNRYESKIKRIQINLNYIESMALQSREELQKLLDYAINKE